MVFESSGGCRDRRLPTGGCDFAETPESGADAARLFWDEAFDPAVLPIVAKRAKEAGSFDLRSLDRYATLLIEPDGERLSLSDGMHRIQLRIVDGSLLAGPVTLEYRIGDQAATAQVQTLNQFKALRRHGRSGAWLQRPEVRAPRWVRQLRALDAVNDGATGREVAAGLFGPQRTDAEWRDRDSPLRSQVRRLIAAARRNAAAGYRDLLRGR